MCGWIVATLRGQEQPVQSEQTFAVMKDAQSRSSSCGCSGKDMEIFQEPISFLDIKQAFPARRRPGWACHQLENADWVFQHVNGCLNSDTYRRVNQPRTTSPSNGNPALARGGGRGGRWQHKGPRVPYGQSRRDEARFPESRSNSWTDELVGSSYSRPLLPQKPSRSSHPGP
jgi:hypothetical protein